MSTNLKVLTLNCWGIPVVSKDRKLRMDAIANDLSTNFYDIVCLQEVWTDSDYKLLSEKVKQKLPYSHYFYSGVLGSGICIFSKYPFQEVFFHQWPINGYVHKLQHGDWFGGKGVGLCKLKVNSYNINIYSAHLHAEYDRKCDEYLAHRVLQAFNTAQFIRLTGSDADVIILAGDLNTEPGDLAYRILTSATALTDSFMEVSDKCDKYLSTNESLNNSYTNTKLLNSQFQGKRIDYIMYRTSRYLKVFVCNYEHPLPDRVPGQDFSYSDHEAVFVSLDITRTDNLIRCGYGPNYKTVLEESMIVCDEAIQRLNYHRRLYWFLTAFLFFMLFVTVGMDAPFSYTIVYHIIRVLITGILCFTLIMATLWNSIEYNAVLAGKMNMEVSFRQLIEYEKSARYL